eukprot:749462-Hanusia_phi.AAC.4
MFACRPAAICKGPNGTTANVNWRPEWQPDKSTKVGRGGIWQVSAWPSLTVSSTAGLLDMHRHCGRVICGSCGKKKYRVPLLKYGYQEPVRVCVSCHEICTQAEELMTAISANGYVAVEVSSAVSFPWCSSPQPAEPARCWSRPQLLYSCLHALHACGPLPPPSPLARLTLRLAGIEGSHQVDAAAEGTGSRHQVHCESERRTMMTMVESATLDELRHVYPLEWWWFLRVTFSRCCSSVKMNGLSLRLTSVSRCRSLSPRLLCSVNHVTSPRLTTSTIRTPTAAPFAIIGAAAFLLPPLPPLPPFPLPYTSSPPSSLLLLLLLLLLFIPLFHFLLLPSSPRALLCWSI